MGQEVVSILLSALGIIITGLATWLSAYLVDLINKKISDENLKKVLTELSELVTNTVKSVYETFVKEIKGTEVWTDEAKKEALNRALTTILSQLSKDTKNFIEKNYGNLEEYLTNLIHAKLYDLKK